MAGLGSCRVLGLAVAALLAGCSAKTILSDATPVEAAFARAARTWDINGDGTVTCEEWRQYAGKLFDEADTARKGHLTPDDFRRLAGTDRLFDVANFAWFDADRDGRITRAELVDRPNPAFRILDRNGDCALGQDELLRAGGGDQTVGGDVGIGGHASRRR